MTIAEERLPLPSQQPPELTSEASFEMPLDIDQFEIPEKCMSCPVMLRIISSVNRLQAQPKGEEKTIAARSNLVAGLTKFAEHISSPENCVNGVATEETVTKIRRKPQQTSTCTSEVNQHLPKHRLSTTVNL